MSLTSQDLIEDFGLDDGDAVAVRKAVLGILGAAAHSHEAEPERADDCYEEFLAALKQCSPRAQSALEHYFREEIGSASEVTPA